MVLYLAWLCLATAPEEFGFHLCFLPSSRLESLSRSESLVTMAMESARMRRVKKEILGVLFVIFVVFNADPKS